MWSCPQSSILNPQSSVLSPQSSILNPQSSILNPQSLISGCMSQSVLDVIRLSSLHTSWDSTWQMSMKPRSAISVTWISSKVHLLPRHKRMHPFHVFAPTVRLCSCWYSWTIDLGHCPPDIPTEPKWWWIQKGHVSHSKPVLSRCSLCENTIIK